MTLFCDVTPQEYLSFFITSMTLLVVAVPEGLQHTEYVCNHPIQQLPIKCPTKQLELRMCDVTQ